MAGFLDNLCGDDYILASDYLMSRDEMTAILSLAGDRNAMPPDVREMADRLAEKAEFAPETATYNETSLAELPEEGRSQVYLVRADGAGTASLQRGGNGLNYFRNADCIVLGETICRDNLKEADADDMAYAKWLMPEEPELDLEKARQIAETYLNVTEISMEFFEAEWCTILENGILKHSGWKLTYTKTAGGLPSVYHDGEWCYVNPEMTPERGAPWDQEFCVLAIDTEGIFELWLQGCTEITEETPTAIKVDGDQAITLAMQYLERIYTGHVNGLGQNLDIEITDAMLGSALVTTDVEGEGEYRPAWYVTYRYRWNGDEELIGQESIVLDALTGSYIEPRIKESRFADILG